MCLSGSGEVRGQQPGIDFLFPLRILGIKLGSTGLHGCPVPHRDISPAQGKEVLTLIVKYTHKFFDLLLTLVLSHCWDNVPTKAAEEGRVLIVAHSS